MKINIFYFIVGIFIGAIMIFPITDYFILHNRKITQKTEINIILKGEYSQAIITPNEILTKEKRNK